jgi:hypothetical protein
MSSPWREINPFKLDGYCVDGDRMVDVCGRPGNSQSCGHLHHHLQRGLWLQVRFHLYNEVVLRLIGRQVGDLFHGFIPRR